MLYIVSTPIGNLKDITLRAIEVLKSVDLIACEDTRHTKILLDHYQISAHTTSYFQHNRLQKEGYLLGLLKEGKSVALVSDAGTPGVLDPGYQLINLALQNNIEVTVIPGATALVAALVLSGKPAYNFYFAGFLPPKSGSKRNRLKVLAEIGSTIVFYESCHRILATLEAIQEVFLEKEVVLVREVTKKFEEVKRGSAKELYKHFKEHKPRGEFVVII